MPPATGDFKGRGNPHPVPKPRRVSYGMILLSVALSVCALLLLLYATINTPVKRSVPNNLIDATRPPSPGAAGTPRPTPATAASPHRQPEQRGHAPDRR